MLLCLSGLLHFGSVSAGPLASRIVSLDLCTDWMLIKHARAGQVLAFSPLLYRYKADWVDEGLPTHNGSLEQILELDPDLVISGEFNAMTLRKRLQQLGKRVEVVAMPSRLDDISTYQQRFLSLTGTSKAVELQSPVYKKQNKTLLLLGANGIGTGVDTLENDVIETAGWNNYLQQPGFIGLDLESLVTNPPDAILWSSPPSNSLANLFAAHPVLKRVIHQPHRLETEYWKWQCPGPWTFDLIQELAQ